MTAIHQWVKEEAQVKYGGRQQITYLLAQIEYRYVDGNLVDTCNQSLIRTLLISVLVVQGPYSERLGGHYVGLYVVFSVFQYTLVLDCTVVLGTSFFRSART